MHYFFCLFILRLILNIAEALTISFRTVVEAK